MPRRVLIADDEPHLVRSLSFVLGKEGYEVLTASDGEEAIAKVRESRPDLVFLDVMMPKRNGYEVCADIKSSPELKETRVIILTAKGQETDRSQGMQAGADDFLTKPFSPMAVLARVKEILG